MDHILFIITLLKCAMEINYSLVLHLLITTKNQRISWDKYSISKYYVT